MSDCCRKSAIASAARAAPPTPAASARPTRRRGASWSCRTAGPGAVVSPPPHGGVFDRIAYATAVGDTVAECTRALDAAEAALRVTVAQPVATG